MQVSDVTAQRTTKPIGLALVENGHPEPVVEADAALMRRIDKLHLKHPIAGARMLSDLLGR